MPFLFLGGIFVVGGTLLVSRAGRVRGERDADDSPKSGMAGLAGAPFRMRLHRVGTEPLAFQAPARWITARPLGLCIEPLQNPLCHR
jgi:hypothetical protein